MNMNEVWPLLLTGVAGVGMGLFFFGGLWYTIRHLAHTRRPVLLLIGSFFVRLSLTLLGFYLVIGGMGGDWKRLLAAFIGFFLARLLLTRQLRVTAPAAERSRG